MSEERNNKPVENFKEFRYNCYKFIFIVDIYGRGCIEKLILRWMELLDGVERSIDWSLMNNR